MKLTIFNELDFLPALRAFFAELQVPINAVTDKPINARDILGNNYKDREPFELIDKIVEVKLFPKWPDNKNELLFTKGLSQAGIKPEQYIQVLVGTGAVQFYRSDIKQVSEMSEINAGMVKTFANASRFYIKKGDQFKLIRLNKEDVMSFLIDKDAAINAVITEKKLNLKKEGDIAQAIQAYNSLP